MKVTNHYGSEVKLGKCKQINDGMSLQVTDGVDHDTVIITLFPEMVFQIIKYLQENYPDRRQTRNDRRGRVEF